MTSHAPVDRLTDYITGKPVPDVGAEANRQAVERLLVEEKGYGREEIAVGAPIDLIIDGETYRSRLDLVVFAGKRPYMVIKCAAGSLESWERHVLAAARLFHAPYPLPVAVVSDGLDAVVLETVSGKPIGRGLGAVPRREAALADPEKGLPRPLSAERRRLEMIRFRSYDQDAVNRLEP